VGPTLINGLPAHVFLVHAVLVLVPLTALALIVSVIWPSWLRRLGIVLPLLALVTLVSVPLTTHAGEWLEKHTEDGPLVHRHTELGDTMLPWAIGLFAVATLVWWLGRGTSTGDASGKGRRGGLAISNVPVHIAAIALSFVVAAGSVVQIYRIGDSGARAAWHDGFSSKAVHHDEG
jgi:hypothetical protein